MYKAIVDAVISEVLPTGVFMGIIPAGTTIQNLRTSPVGDDLTGDGQHLNELGKHAAALTWFAALGGNLEEFAWKVGPYEEKHGDTIRWAVQNALAHPLEVTFFNPEEDLWQQPIDLTAKNAEIPRASMAEVFASLGKDINDYTELKTTDTIYGYYDSTGPSSIRNTAKDSPRYYATQIFAKTQIPVGSIVIIEEGYEYRPEGWKKLNKWNTAETRPGVESRSVVEVDEEWWGEWRFRGFTVSHESSRKLNYFIDLDRLHIFVPNK